MADRVLVITELLGPSAELLAASDRIAAEVGTRDGLLLRLRGTTQDGIVVINLWDSDETRAAAAADHAHAAARERSGIGEIEQGARTTVVRDVRVDDVSSGV